MNGARTSPFDICDFRLQRQLRWSSLQEIHAVDLGASMLVRYHSPAKRQLREGLRFRMFYHILVALSCATRKKCATFCHILSISCDNCFFNSSSSCPLQSKYRPNRQDNVGTGSVNENYGWRDHRIASRALPTPRPAVAGMKLPLQRSSHATKLPCIKIRVCGCRATIRLFAALRGGVEWTCDREDASRPGSARW